MLQLYHTQRKDASMTETNYNTLRLPEDLHRQYADLAAKLTIERGERVTMIQVADEAINALRVQLNTPTPQAA